MELMMTKTRFSREGCRITTVVRRHPIFGMTEEVILQAEDLIPQPTELAVEEEDTGRWLIAGM